MLVNPPDSPIFAPPTSLPRGPHGLGREDVRASQAARLHRAIAAIVAERGYADTTIGAIVERAGVSRATFYEHYTDKNACYCAAYARFVDVLFERIAVAVPEGADWWAFVDTALAGYLGTLDADPAAARAFVLEIDGAGPAARAQSRQAYARMAAFVRARHETMRRHNPALGPLPAEAYLALVHGVRGLVRDALDTDPRPPLAALAPSVREWVGSMVRGA